MNSIDPSEHGKALAALGASKGGKARAAKLTSAERSEIARAAAQARWEGQQDTEDTPLPRATHEGPLRIGEIEIPSAVLEGGTRVLSRTGFLRAIGRKGKAKGGRRYDLESKLPVFLTADNLKPFITKELLENSNPVPFRTMKRGVPAMGYRADLLPQVCNVFLDARDAGVLRPNQEHIAATCKILSRGFSVVGLAALIDEATGYQEVRDRQALQAILDKFLRKAFAAWAKRFPDEFYREIFRLRNWEWKDIGTKRPGIVAHYTNDIVYARLAPGLLKELEERNPKDERGGRKAKHHQWLTEDVGHPALAQHLYAVIGLMRIAEDGDWDGFMRMLDRAYKKQGESLQLALFSEAA